MTNHNQSNNVHYKKKADETDKTEPSRQSYIA